MPDTLIALVPVKGSEHLRLLRGVILGQAACRLPEREFPLRGCVNFHAIASAEQQEFLATPLAKHCDRAGMAGETFAYVDWRGTMIDTNAKKFHHAR
jgi:hypothetical protein